MRDRSDKITVTSGASRTNLFDKFKGDQWRWFTSTAESGQGVTDESEGLRGNRFKGSESSGDGSVGKETRTNVGPDQIFETTKTNEGKVAIREEQRINLRGPQLLQFIF